MTDDMAELERELTGEQPKIQPRKPGKRRTPYNAKRSPRAHLYPEVSMQVYYAVLAEAKRTKTRTHLVASAIITQWYHDCLEADRRAFEKQQLQQEKKNPPG